MDVGKNEKNENDLCIHSTGTRRARAAAAVLPVIRDLDPGATMTV